MTRHNTIKVDFASVLELSADTDPGERYLSPETVQLCAAVLTSLRPKWFWHFGGDLLTDEQLLLLTDYLDLAIAQVLEPVVTTEPPEPGECSEYGPDAPMLQYWPNHPVLQPDIQYNWPSGGLVTSWYQGCTNLGGLLGTILGCQATDIYNTLLIPWGGEEPPDVDENYPPSFTLWVRGEGRVLLRLLKIPFGGLALIVVDDNPLSLTIENLAVDPLELADPEGDDFVDETISEITLSGSGLHKIQVGFMFTLDTSPPFIGYGGGLRGVVLCGENLVGEVPLPELQVVDCTLQVRYDGGAWQDVAGDYNLCGTGVDVRVNPAEPCEVQVTHDGGETWDFLIDVCTPPQLMVRQSTVTPSKLEYSPDSGDTWIEFADMQTLLDDLPPQLMVRQNETNPCKLEYSPDGGDTWIVYATLTDCDTTEPPDPPVGTTDPQCSAAYAAATEIANTVRTIVDDFTTVTVHSFADLANFFTYIRRSWPGFFNVASMFTMFTTMLAHVGTGSDYAPVLDADVDDCIAELACGAYCAILDTPAPLIPWGQSDWGDNHVDGNGDIVLYDATRSAAQELLDVCVAWLRAEAWTPAQWSVYLTQWSQQEDTTFNCVAESGCGAPSFGSVFTLDGDNLWVGAVSAEWGATYSSGVWYANDIKAPGSGATDYRRSVHISVQLPRGDVTDVQVAYAGVSLGTTPPSVPLRAWLLDYSSVSTQIIGVGPTVPASGVASWSGEITDAVQLNVFFNIDEKTSAAALTGTATLTSIEVTYADGSAQVFDVPVTLMGGIAGALRKHYYQVWEVDTLYEGGGGSEYWGGIESDGTICYKVRAGVSSGGGDWSQSTYYDCAGGGGHTFTPSDRWANTTDLVRAHRFRSEFASTQFLLLEESGTES